MPDSSPPTWAIKVSGIRERIFEQLFAEANASVHTYMQALIAHYGNDTTAIATTADTALYQIRSSVGAALAILGSTVSEGGTASVDITGSASYLHSDKDFVSVEVYNSIAEVSNSIEGFDNSATKGEENTTPETETAAEQASQAGAETATVPTGSSDVEDGEAPAGDTKTVQVDETTATNN